MANEVQVTTVYSFTSDDGTAYAENRSYYTDANTTASYPRRFVFNAYSTEASCIIFSGDDYTEQPSGPGLFILFNRDERVDMYVTLRDVSSNPIQTRVLGPGEWLFLDIYQFDSAAAANPFTYAADNIGSVGVYCEFGSANGEYFAISKAAS